LSNLTWDNIADACQTSQYDALRQKVRSISDARENLTLAETKRYCESIFQNEMVTLINILWPKTLFENAFKGIIGNISPLGWYSLTQDIQQQEKVKKNYNWMYFIIVLTKMTNANIAY
jgi:hypothetical protein